VHALSFFSATFNVHHKKASNTKLSQEYNVFGSKHDKMNKMCEEVVCMDVVDNWA